MLLGQLVLAFTHALLSILVISHEWEACITVIQCSCTLLSSSTAGSMIYLLPITVWIFDVNLGCTLKPTGKLPARAAYVCELQGTDS